MANDALGKHCVPNGGKEFSGRDRAYYGLRGAIRKNIKKKVDRWMFKIGFAVYGAATGVFFAVNPLGSAISRTFIRVACYLLFSAVPPLIITSFKEPIVNWRANRIFNDPKKFKRVSQNLARSDRRLEKLLEKYNQPSSAVAGPEKPDPVKFTPIAPAGDSLEEALAKMEERNGRGGRG